MNSRNARPGRVMILAVSVAVLAVIGAATLVAVHLRATADTSAAGPAHSGPAALASGTHSRSASPAKHSPSPQPSTSPPALPLAGKVVGIDPGHNGGNFSDPSYINRLIWNGREMETCDTTGTETDGGYTEAQYNFNVALYLRADLIAAGARVVLTRTSDDGVGPCVNRRSELINDAHANVAVDIHADGGPSWGRGFTVLEPVADGPNDKVIGSSVRFGSDVRLEMLRDTHMPVSDYYGSDGIEFRDDLAGLNLSTVPKILIECGNMRNAVDAGILTTASFQKQIAAALAAAITRFLT